MRQLSFRESLLVSEIDAIGGSREVEPKPVGGLNLNIEFVDGYISEDSELPFEEKVDQDIAQVLKRTKGKV